MPKSAARKIEVLCTILSVWSDRVLPYVCGASRIRWATRSTPLSLRAGAAHCRWDTCADSCSGSGGLSLDCNGAPL